MNLYNCISIQDGSPVERLSDMNRTAEAFSLASFLVEGDCLSRQLPSDSLLAARLNHTISSVTAILLPSLWNSIPC